MDANRRKMVRSFAAGFLSGSSLLSFASLFYLATRWYRSAPRLPDPGHGLAFPFNSHGSIGYFSAFQAASLLILLGAFGLFLILAMWIAPLKKVVGKKVSWVDDDPRNVGRWGLAFGAAATCALIYLPGPSIIRWLVS